MAFGEMTSCFEVSSGGGRLRGKRLQDRRSWEQRAFGKSVIPLGAVRKSPPAVALYGLQNEISINPVNFL